MNENYFAQLSLVSAPRPNVVEGPQLLLDVFIYIGCTDNAQKWWQVIASHRTVFATTGTDVRICARLAAFCQLQLSRRPGPGVPCAFRQAPSAQEQGLVRQAKVTRRVDSGGPWGCGAGNRKTRFTSSFSVCVLTWQGKNQKWFNPLKPELNPICYLLALLGAHHFLHVSRIRVKLLTLRWLMSYIYGAPILDVSRSHTTTQHSR